MLIIYCYLFIVIYLFWQFGCSTFYRKPNRPWVAPPAIYDSDMEIEDDSDLDDSDLDPDYVLEEEEVDVM